MKDLIHILWKIPFIRFIAPFILGVFAAAYFQIDLDISLSLALLFFGLTIVYRPFLNHKSSYHKRWIFGFLVSTAMFFLSFSLTVKYNIVDTNVGDATLIIGMVDENPQIRAKSIKLVIKTKEFEKKDVWIKDNSKILVYIENDSLASTIKYGDMLLLKGNLKRIENAGNPYEFNYEKYLHRKLIYFQSYQSSKQWQRIAKNQGNYLYSFAYSVRNKILDIYKKAGISGDEFAILSALTLGVKDYLSDEIVKNYSHSGAMHVLAVSGLHVGILTIMLNFLLAGLIKNPKLRLIYTAIVIFVLWLFAIMTGLTPSVTRSALMFTFYVLSQNSGSRINTFNSLAASAFIILIINPNSLFHVGFQLSFLAVGSILLLQSKIYGLLTINNKIGDKIWQLSTVSIAAQIGTSPISIYYFHQFPIYALLSNIIVIPAAMIIMYLTVFLIVSSFLQPIANFTGIILSFVISMLNKSTATIENLPFSSIEYIGLSSIEVILIYTAILLSIVMYIIKDRKMLFVILIIMIISFSIRNYNHYNNLTTNTLIIFKTQRQSAIAKINNQTMNLYADSSVINNKQNVNYLCSNIRTAYSIKDFQTHSLSSDNIIKFPFKFIHSNNKIMAYLSGKTDRLTSKNKMQVNYIVLGNNSTINIDNLQSLFNFDLIIIDSSMPQWKQKIIERDCGSNKIECFNVNKKGAFVASF